MLFLALISVWLPGCASVAKQEPSAPFFDGEDDFGTRVVLQRRPERIVSMNLPVDEILVALIEPERIAALSWWASEEGLSCVTERAKAFPAIHVRSPEAVLAKKPDLVITTDGTEPEVTKTLRDMGVPVFVSRNPTQVEDIFPRIERIGAVAGAEEKSEALLRQLRARLDRVRERVADIPDEERPIVMAFAFTKPFGQKGMLFDDMCHKAGFKNGVAIAMGDTGLYPISKEQVIAVNPDIFLMPVWSSDHKDAEEYKRNMVNDPAYRDVKAVRNGKLLTVEDRYRFSASQYLVDAVEKMAEAVYPERFSEK